MRVSDLAQDETLDLGPMWWLIALIGVLSLVAGVILIAKPSHSLTVLAVVFGIFIVLDGIVELIGSITGNVTNRGLAAIVGVLGLIVGIVLIRHPTGSVNLIGILIGLWLIVAGVMRLLRAIVFAGRRLLGFALAALEIAIGIAIVANPHIGYGTLAILAGIWLILSGVGTIVLAFMIRAARDELREQSVSADATTS
jgi:uncharacterized membrane protein HdeD (DUF308 family)